MSTSIKKNYLYNLIYQVIVLILPLITVPYISRVLLPKGVGIFAYTSSVVQYFILIGMLGIGTYGNKVIAMTRDNKKLMSENFFSIYFLQLAISLFSVVSYLLMVTLFVSEDKGIAYIQTIALLGSVIDCSWFFSGLELFKKIVTRNIVVKIIALIAIFIFVKGPDDLGTYTYIMCLSIFIGQLIMWFYIRSHIIFVHVSFEKINKHLRPTIVYFLPQIAAQVYFVLGKTMIGMLSSKSEVGIYDYADKMKAMALAVVTSLGTVMLPRMAHTFVMGQIEKAKGYIMKSLEFSTLLAVPIMFGLAGIAKEFVPWYMGDSFTKCIIVLVLMSPTIFLIAWSGVFGSQYLVPLGKMREYTLSLYAGAFVNLIANLLLIRPYGSIGAAIGTLLAELAVTLVQLYFIKSEIRLVKILPSTLIYLCAGLVMYLVVRIIGLSMGVSILTTLIQIIAGVISYLVIVLISEYIRGNGIMLNEVKKRRQNH
ncbi:oligosaccharide flippase family protein [Sporolactobacillus kofuensis]|uniref:Oligosaccharide flippase family protein n=1 Tax=Sporolactobacillus kofuensis TaxID=269672 RepID=A0ABW1WH52_9BACL|nr:oligosaccharide flippase family protein [Sporolactobacillus kofuensis]MCO7177117.1 oligosaccharide flippase family protein [Sporolactobacillus kofuensis]